VLRSQLEDGCTCPEELDSGAFMELVITAADDYSGPDGCGRTAPQDRRSRGAAKGIGHEYFDELYASKWSFASSLDGLANMPGSYLSGRNSWNSASSTVATREPEGLDMQRQSHGANVWRRLSIDNLGTVGLGEFC
jgi:hypothetical protein